MLHMPLHPAHQTLEYLFRDREGAIEVCGLPASGGSPLAQHFDASAEGLADASDWLCDIAERGYRCYFGLQPRRQALEGAAKRASDTDVAGCITIALDFDDGPALTRAATGLFKRVEPSLVIRTGTVPSKRAWVLWVLREASTDPSWFDLARDLAHVTGADVAATNPSRIARAPGFLSMPPAHKIERGYIDEMTALTHTGDKYDPETLRAALTDFINAQPKQQRSASPFERKVGKFSGLVEPLNLEALKDNCRSDSDWNNSMWRLVGHWLRQGLSDDDVVALAQPLTAPGYSAADTEYEVREMIWRTREKQGVQPRDLDEPATPTQTPAPTIERKTRSRGLTLYRPDQMVYTGPQPMLLEDLVPFGAVGFVAADSNVGKSFFSIGASVAISAGAPFLGKATQPAFCFYVGLEGKRELQNRFAAAFKGQGIDPKDCNLAFASGEFALGSSDDLDALVEMYRSAQDGDGPGLLIIDTFSQAIAGEKENDNDAMSLVVKNMTWLADELNATVLACHHVSKGTLDPRGAGALRGNTDTVILLEKTDNQKAINIWTNKQRDGSPCEPFQTQIQDVELVSPETGEAGWKGYMELSDVQPKQVRKQTKLTEKEQRVYDALVQFDPSAWRKNEHPKPSIPAGIWHVEQGDFVAHLLSRGLVASPGNGRSYVSNLVVKGVVKKVENLLWNTNQEQFVEGQNERF